MGTGENRRKREGRRSSLGRLVGRCEMAQARGMGFISVSSVRYGNKARALKNVANAEPLLPSGGTTLFLPAPPPGPQTRNDQTVKSEEKRKEETMMMMMITR